MDYGKLAYLKAVDLENRRTQTSGLHVRCLKRRALAAGENELFKVDGNGEIAVFINASTCVVAFVDGAEVCRGEHIFFKINDGGVVTVKNEQSIDEVAIMIIGDIGDYEDNGIAYADINGDTIGYVICDDVKASAYKATLPDLSPQIISDGEYIQGDICAYKDGFILAFVDKDGTVSIMNEREKHNYFLNAQKVAVSYDDVLTVAYIKDGKLYYFKGAFGDDIADLKKVAFKGFVDDVRVVKRSSDLLFSSDGKCYIKRMSWQ